MRLFFLIYTLASTALAGIFITAVLTMSLQGWQPIVWAAGLGAIVAMPAAWVAARKIREL